MIRRMSRHAWERMQERRGAKRYEHCLNKMKKWSKNLPDDGFFYRKGVGYVVRGGVLVTCFLTDKRRGMKISNLEYYLVEE